MQSADDGDHGNVDDDEVHQINHDSAMVPMNSARKSRIINVKSRILNKTR